MRTVVGIDLGTTFSALARLESGRPVVVRSSQGRATTPSVIYFPGEGQAPVVGADAKAMQDAGEADVACFFKRRMGDPSFHLEYHGRRYTARDLSAILLRSLLQETIGSTAVQAIITVPAYFGHAERADTLAAAGDAGIQVIGIVNEPTAAAIAYGLGAGRGKTTALIYDLGGGTFDVTIVKYDQLAAKAEGGGRGIFGWKKKETEPLADYQDIQILGTDGDHELGGRDWDDRLLRQVAVRFADEFSVDPMEDPVACLALRTRCEAAKLRLSAMSKTIIQFDHAGKRGAFEVTRASFEELTRDLVGQTLTLTENALRAVKLGWDDIQLVVPVGGSTRMPMINEALRKRYRGAFAEGVDPDEVVALGAALEAARRVEGHKQTDDTQQEEPMYLPGIGKSVAVRDVTAHSLGMVAETADRKRFVNSFIIPKNNAVPARVVRQFQQRTRRGGLSESEVYVMQGESDRPSECILLGKYVIGGIKPEPKGLAVLDIGYRYDENSVVQVAAVQRSTGAALPVRVEPVPADMSWLDRDPRELDPPPEPTSVFLAIDLSGSMSGRPLAGAQDAARRFVKELDLSTASVGLTLFADTVHTMDLSQSARELMKGIDRWAIGAVGGGNSTHPFDDLSWRLRSVGGQRFIVVLTDGEWDAKCCENALRTADQLKDDNVQIIALGFGHADKAFLRKLANSEEDALLTNLESLGAQFSRIAQVMNEGQRGPEATSGKSRFFGF